VFLNEVELEGSSYRNESSSRRPRSPERYSSSSKRHHSRSRSRSRSYSPERHWPTLEAGVEEDFLRTVAKKVKEHGENFESVIRAREKDNPKFAFFSDRNVGLRRIFDS
jgi:U2-associated protein SR140